MTPRKKDEEQEEPSIRDSIACALTIVILGGLVAYALVGFINWLSDDSISFSNSGNITVVSNSPKYSEETKCLQAKLDSEIDYAPHIACSKLSPSIARCAQDGKTTFQGIGTCTKWDIKRCYLATNDETHEIGCAPVSK